MGWFQGSMSKVLSRVVLVCLVGLSGVVEATAQTDPVPESLAFSQSFSATPHNSATYPTGWQGWRIGTSASTSFETSAPSADVVLIANSTAALNSGGVHNYNGALGILNSATMNAAIVLSFSTSAHSAVQVDYQLSTIRNPYNGSTNTRIEEATLQYRVGTSGSFTTLAGPVYTTGTTSQTSAVTTPLNPLLFTRTLPSACDHQPVVQLRWVVRDLSGSGSRPSIAIDQVSVTGNSHPLFVGGSGRGDASNGFIAPPISASLFSGGAGRGDESDGYTSVPITASLYSGGNGRGDMSNGFLSAPINASLFSGGLGRGDVSDGYTAAPITASLYSGGNGRGDVSNGFSTPPISVSLFSGGAGRGDETDAYTAAPITASLYSGGNGRGDVSNGFLSAPITASLFGGGAGRGDVSDGYTAAPITASLFSGGSGRGDRSDAFSAAPIEASIYSGGAGRGDHSAAYDHSLHTVALSVRALLAGPFDALTGLQHDSLRVQDLVPLMEPYTAMGYPLTSSSGTTIPASALAAGGHDAIVDWVVVELRDPLQPTNISASRCLLLQRDGDIVDPYSRDTVYFSAAPGAHHISVHHRNHLGAMTAAPLPLGPSATLIDFSQTATPTYGTNARNALSGVALLWPGDVLRNGEVKYTGNSNDRDPILVKIGGTIPTNVVGNSYCGEDVNMDGQVKYTGIGNDRDIILQTIGGTVPTNVRLEQVP